jgi:hypothetical protein
MPKVNRGLKDRLKRSRRSHKFRMIAEGYKTLKPSRAIIFERAAQLFDSPEVAQQHLGAAESSYEINKLPPTDA